MKNKKIILAGGTGFIGEELVKYFGRDNDIVILTRQVVNAKNNRNQYQSLTAEDTRRVKYVQWNAKLVDVWKEELEGSDLLIRHKIGLPAFEWMLKIGAGLIGTETELVSKSRRVVPTRLLESGFHFKYPLLEEALEDIISKVPRKQYHLF